MPTEESEAPALAPPSRAPRLDALIDAWFVERFHGAPAMRDTDAYNHVRAAVDALKTELDGLLRRDAGQAIPAAAPRSEERHLGD